MNKIWRLLPLIFFAILIGFFWRGLSSNPHLLPSVQLGKPLAPINLPLLNNEQERFSAQIFKGKMYLLNVWASWCSSCNEEQTFLLELAKQGVLILGLNYKDDPEHASNWLKEWGNPYQAVGIDKEGKAGIELGVYGTPETFLIDENGIILYRHAGVLDETVWRNEFMPRIKKSRGVL